MLLRFVWVGLLGWILNGVFGTATVITNIGKAMTMDRLGTTPGTYTTPPKWFGIGVGATGAARTAVAADTALSTEVESRVAGTESRVTTTQTGDTLQVLATITVTANRNVDEAGLFDAVSSGHMYLSATFPVLGLLNGDSVQLTGKSQAT
jgi:hypothetical protein